MTKSVLRLWGASGVLGRILEAIWHRAYPNVSVKALAPLDDFRARGCPTLEMFSLGRRMHSNGY